MKRVVLAVVGVLAIGAPIWARLDPSKMELPPKLALPQAYEAALKALGEDAKTFHCLGAQAIVAGCPDGEWRFQFFSVDGQEREAVVCFDGRVRIEKFIQRAFSKRDA